MKIPKHGTNKMKFKEKTIKKTRGYRLKPATHEMIIKIQGLLKSDQDAVIAGACTMFYSELKKKSIEQLTNHSKLITGK